MSEQLPLKKVSRFEFAIAQVADPEGAKKLEPCTEAEEIQQRRENMEKQMSKFITKEEALHQRKNRQ